MIAIFGVSPTQLIGLALLFASLIGAVLALDTARGRELLRRFAWFRRFELLGPSELRYRGMIMLGLGVCCFAALVTLRLFDPVSPWPALALSIAAVVAITLGAVFFERAAGP